MSAPLINAIPEYSTKIWREYLQQQQSQLRAHFESTADTAKLLRLQSALVDNVLRDLWSQLSISDEIALIAVGGYGRGELFPYSDVDLLILLPDRLQNAMDSSIEALVGVFWDIGLAVGHSVRSLSECLSEAEKDITVQTNLLESRFLTGNKKLYQDFKTKFCKALDVTAFYEAKIHEQEQRHARFNDTTYNLEPNIKESPGGLRDLQNILWISRSLGLGASWGALVKQGLISQSEARQIRRHELHLEMLRARLHYLSNRREDRLIFDFQNDLAKQLGHVTSGRKRASEQLMHDFYRSAKFVSFINEILLQLLHERIYPSMHETKPINARFDACNGLLEAKSSTLLQKNPSAILESFLLLEQHPELTGMSANLLRTLHRVKKLVNRDFRQSAKNKTLFLDILKQPNGVTHALRRMNRYGILGSYIPAFGKIVGQMQHDLFHVYTVDEHILNVLRNLRRFALPKHAHEFPLCSKLFAEFDSPYLLYLGAIFHDIAKGRGGDHSTLGTVDALRFCKAHGLSKVDSELVAWLVESHLVMSSTAQKSDLSDPAVIEGFARFIKDERNLVALYLLTVADIRGTSPKVWNAWKAKLLENLFLTTMRLLKCDIGGVDAEMLSRQQHARVTLSHYGVVDKDYASFWKKLDKNYFLRYESQEIAWHTRLLLSHIKSKQPIVRARLSPAGDGIQTLIYIKDRDDLFARICVFFERIGYNILEAKIHTTQHGYAIDSFLVSNYGDNSVSYRDVLSYIEFELAQKLHHSCPLETPLQGRVSRQVKHTPFKIEISIRADKNSNNHILNVIMADRPGLLSKLAHLFLNLGIHLHTAKINTLGNRAEDSFMISAKDGKQLEAESVKRLEDELLSQF
ncbi:[protein-PII] uridylyltransferase [Methyloradius palustris]|uniref:Bifunctional uridylyltransferase/uridylyl-removing enzyme n=1 Tax=Methyloradius palustris TaxID=2778876 RepID=A0A8D5K0S4_9PROT|nr:[protein-PII] uridylyltransferase [Methyloradius palustris]BCM25033.1 bifunctional uridylyltransferase/uridylyl-removing enzyme [Methyloradius palustris]